MKQKKSVRADSKSNHSVLTWSVVSQTIQNTVFGNPSAWLVQQIISWNYSVTELKESQIIRFKRHILGLGMAWLQLTKDLAWLWLELHDFKLRRQSNTEYVDWLGPLAKIDVIDYY